MKFHRINIFKMDRRNTRLKREYLYRKNNETQDRMIHQRKQELRNALESGNAIPFDLKNDAKLKKDVLLDEGENGNKVNIININIIRSFDSCGR